jgi:integrase
MPKKLYTAPATCHICGKAYLARYNVGERARVCTLPEHKCKREERILAGGKRKVIQCVEGCCRSKYARSASAAMMDNAIDPRKVLSNEEFGATIKDSRKVSNPIGICIRFIAAIGCRLRESLLVRARDVILQQGKVSVVKTPTLKRGGRPIRSVYIRNSHPVMSEIRDLLKHRKPNDLLFPVAARTLQRAVELILEKRKPDRASLVHIFRHTRASQLLKAGVDPNVVRQQLGWSSIEMLKIYAHTDKDTLANALSDAKI